MAPPQPAQTTPQQPAAPHANTAAVPVALSPSPAPQPRHEEATWTQAGVRQQVGISEKAAQRGQEAVLADNARMKKERRGWASMSARGGAEDGDGGSDPAARAAARAAEKAKNRSLGLPVTEALLLETALLEVIN